MANEQEIMTEKQAAKYLGFSKQSLTNWRCKCCGPAYLKLHGKTIRYLREDLDAFLKSGRVVPAAEQKPLDAAQLVREDLEAAKEVANG